MQHCEPKKPEDITCPHIEIKLCETCKTPYCTSCRRDRQEYYKIAVLAGNIRQFNAFDIKNTNREKYIYVDRVERAIGCRFTGVEVIGTFWEDVKESGRLYDEVRARIFPKGDLCHCSGKSTN